VEFTVPQYVRDAAAEGLEFHREGLSGDGVVERTVREAAAMARGEVSEDKAVRVSAWAARHAVDLEAEGARPGEDGYPTPGAVAHLLWGIPTGAQYQDARAFWDNLAERIREQERYMITPVEARTEGSGVEFRTFAGELRVEGDGNTFVGYAAVFNSDSEPLPFTERILPGAFGKSIRSRKRDVRAYINHDSNMVLASTRSGTLSLTEDERGLRAEFVLPDTSYARDLSSLMRDGIVDKMSFGFTVPRGGDRWSEDGRTRELREIVLHEVSVVTGFPAYEGTTAAVRSLETLCERTGMSVDEIAQVIQRLADRPQETVEASAANLLELKRRQAELAAKKVV
jgi:HK97 family phage prohead protease